MFELPKNKGRAQPLGRKSVTGSSTDITSPKKVETERIRISASRDDSSVGEFHSRSVSPRKVCNSQELLHSQLHLYCLQMSTAIRIPSNHGSHSGFPSHHDVYSKTFSGQGKGVTMTLNRDRGRHTSDTRRQESADRDSDCEESNYDQVSYYSEMRLRYVTVVLFR